MKTHGRQLYVVTADPPELTASQGVPTPHLFLVGLPGPAAPDRLGPGESLLRVRVEPGGVVDLSSIDVHVPPVVQLLLCADSPTYLLPAGLLSRTRLTAAYTVRPAGGFAVSH